MKKFRYNIINKNGQQEPWTGVFQNEKEAFAWFEKHGAFHINRGHRLVLVASEADEPTLDSVTEENFFFLDQSDQGYWLIKTREGRRYSAGYNKQKAKALIMRLNMAHRPSLEQTEPHKIQVCWNNHEKAEKCTYETELLS